MRLVIQKQPTKAKQSRKIFFRVKLMALVVLIYFGVMYVRPLPEATIQLDLPTAPAAESTTLAWPDQGRAAISAEGYDFIAQNALDKPVSTASMAKVITVLSVLDKKPLAVGENGPVLTMTEEDFARSEHEYSRDGTRLAITVGERLTQKQAIVAIMLPSANNIADTLAVWAFGSLEDYRAYAQNFLAKNGINHTQIGPDASGYSDETVSTPADLTLIAKLALKNPVVREVAAMKSADFETAGTVYNHNRLVGDGLITGLKTGRNDSNTGSLLFTAKTRIKNQPINIAGTVVDAGNMPNALRYSRQLAESAVDDFEYVKYVSSGQQIGYLKTAWGEKVAIQAADTIDFVRWKGSEVFVANTLKQTDGLTKGSIGELSVRAVSQKYQSNIKTASKPKGPGFWWRISTLR